MHDGKYVVRRSTIDDKLLSKTSLICQVFARFAGHENTQSKIRSHRGKPEYYFELAGFEQVKF
jgi:hypothetical protein